MVKLVADMSDIAKVVRTSEHDWTAYDITYGPQQEDGRFTKLFTCSY